MGRENRLTRETSPYLLQHAHNPVDWWPWCAEALAEAKRADKPILLSIGYAACHWCHVMERESFEDERTAALMNEHFVCIKVDREERPDLDEIYMQATVAMTGSGGWPMTVFLTPEQKPFFAGTYFPPENRYGRPGFKTLLARIAELWRSDRVALGEQAEDLTRALSEQLAADEPSEVAADAIAEAESQLARAFDATWGGFSRAPKFPPAEALRLLLRHHLDSGSERPLAMARRTLDGMMNGGMYDQLGGGFHRYSTDERWLAPHFEKMLYDNALLSVAYAEAYQVARDDRYRRVVCETLDYWLAEMTSPEGGFYSSTDADAEGEEGKSFVWTPEEVEAVLPASLARAFCAYYDVTPEGNWQEAAGKSILHLARPLDEVALELGMPAARLAAELDRARDKMARARRERGEVARDDKVLTAWNALAISAFAECGRILAQERYLAAAARAADFLLTRLRRPDGGLYRSYRAGRAHLPAYLEDYAFLCDALIDCYEAGARGRSDFIAAANDLGARIIADFHDPESGAFSHTARDHEPLIVKSREGQDGAIPSANAIAARALVRLSWHFGRRAERYREIAAGAIRAHGRLITRAPRAFISSLLALDLLRGDPVVAVICGPIGDPRAAALRRELGRVLLPRRAIVHLEPGGPSHADPELTAGKEPLGGVPTLFACRGMMCKAPVSDPAQVAAAVRDA